MAKKQAYLIRWEDGTMRTVQAYNVRDAGREFVELYQPPRGARIGVKLRGSSDDWVWFSLGEYQQRTVRAPT